MRHGRFARRDSARALKLRTDRDGSERDSRPFRHAQSQFSQRIRIVSFATARDPRVIRAVKLLSAFFLSRADPPASVASRGTPHTVQSYVSYPSATATSAFLSPRCLVTDDARSPGPDAPRVELLRFYFPEITIERDVTREPTILRGRWRKGRRRSLRMLDFRFTFFLSLSLSSYLSLAPATGPTSGLLTRPRREPMIADPEHPEHPEHSRQLRPVDRDRGIYVSLSYAYIFARYISKNSVRAAPRGRVTWPCSRPVRRTNGETVRGKRHGRERCTSVGQARSPPRGSSSTPLTLSTPVVRG